MASGRLIDYLGIGPLSARPAAPNLAPNVMGLWYSSDIETLSVWDGSAWDDVTTQLDPASAAALALAESAVQPGDPISTLANDAGYVDAAETDARITVQKGLAGGLATLGGDARIPVAQVHQKLEALTGGTWMPEVSGDNLNVAGTSPVEVSLGVKNTGGGTAVFHYYFKPSGGGYPGNGQLLGGAGSRPWAGSDWTAHSTAAYHLIATEAHTASAQGTDFAILATPIGSTESSRVQAARFNGDGDIINSLGLTQRKLNPIERGRGVEIVRQGNAAEFSMASNFATTYASLLRGYALGGTIAAPAATQVNRGCGYALCGHDGAGFVGAKAMLTLISQGNWTSTSTPAAIFFETTAADSTTRTTRWIVGDAGHFVPGADNAYDVGSASFRPRQYYGANATISTSDARLKTAPRDMTDAEVSAFSVIARLPNVWQWIARVESEGDAARLHAGPTVQAAIAVMEAHGLAWNEYAAFCYDEWGEEAEVSNPETGEVLQAYRPAGDRYSFRREELLAWIVRAQAAQLDSLSARVAAIEAKGNP